ncbi:WSC domain-containing protein 2 isoform X1 [Daphnia magna]|uniref:WSC domain-containing protein 2 isoform X1 n=1 Tax=Daphnia magna TaxID=35525 RepID=UPI001E1BB615|nr:WSC domain-containing protein 2 isoform X1 [Daphnia magna]XP_032783332.2 WSC domain-containing protein 2 isoform X1 [Daphnia magna]XP_045028317.1 WSC domain-containing protein 2 isoform X1 [Daphnia magna]XP_045028318.1 WSC domain-containing protein 2 isoform X1 [Daphnia magna]
MALVSNAGSGNTWLRGVIERLSGYFTGSAYTSKKLFVTVHWKRMANICCSRNETMAEYYAGSPKSDMETWTNGGWIASSDMTFPYSNVIRADLLEVIRPSGVIRSVGF